jgi:hypothetical protein
LRKKKVLQISQRQIEDEIRAYALDFLGREYGEGAQKKLQAYSIITVDSYDCGGVSEATEDQIIIAIKRDLVAGKLTETTKLVVRHELGHILDETAPLCPTFEEEVAHEKIAWKNAKPKTAAERWYMCVSLRTHIDPLKMQAVGFPQPQTKIAPQKLIHAAETEAHRMGQESVFVDETWAERLAMAHLLENPDYYSLL